jgi:8-oxo-dGTP diphosphatase
MGRPDCWPVRPGQTDSPVCCSSCARTGPSTPAPGARRAAAPARSQGELAGLAARGVTALPPGVQAGALDRWFPQYILVLEGQAKAAVPGLADSDGVRVVAAPGSGDDTIAELAASVGGHRVVVTADRELRRRAVAAGATVAGPRWLLDLL